MIILIKKWNVLLLCALLILSVAGVGLLVRRPRATPTVSLPGFGKRIIVDAGHGEPDGGAVGRQGVMEKDLNLAVARLLQGYLEQGGMEVLLTRSDDDGVYDESSRSIRQKKNSDLKNRRKMINGSEGDLFVSIHMNHFSDSRYNGPQVFYAESFQGSQQLAEAVQKEMIALLAPKSERAVKPSDGGIYLLREVNLPSILVECGFLSNQEEEALLLDTDYQRKIAFSIYCGILKYFSELE